MPIVIDTNMRRMPAHARAPIFFCCGESSLALRENSRSFSGGTLGRNTSCMMRTKTKKMFTKNGTCHPMTASVPDSVENTMAMTDPTAFAAPIMPTRSWPAKKCDMSVGTIGYTKPQPNPKNTRVASRNSKFGAKAPPIPPMMNSIWPMVRMVFRLIWYDSLAAMSEAGMYAQGRQRHQQVHVLARESERDDRQDRRHLRAKRVAVASAQQERRLRAELRPMLRFRIHAPPLMSLMRVPRAPHPT